MERKNMPIETNTTPSYSSGMANKNIQSNNTTNFNARTDLGRFNKRKLPLPIAVLYMLNICTGRVNRHGYWIIRCPFHKNGTERTPSLNLHQVNGNFLCHACGTKGGDILAFYMQVTGDKFIDAAKQLGAWEYDK